MPELKSRYDYLIDEYADKGNFFDNLDAIQSGLSSISLYSGSFVRGTLDKTYNYWSLGLSPHVDQSFYIYSPYTRGDNRALFASAAYPYLLDSIGFPNMMVSAAEALDSSVTYRWSDSSHSQVAITCNGETHTYGGAGNIKGQGISEDKISKYFDFNDGSSGMSPGGVRDLLVHYASVEMKDDIPREDALTWKQISDNAGSGSWARVSPGGLNMDTSAFTYLYQDGDGSVFDADEMDDGISIYWAGDLEYADDAWVDGRYVDKWQKFVPGARFEDHPESDIILKDVMIPQIPCSFTWGRNETTGKSEMVYHVDGDITEEKRTVVFRYKDGEWVVWSIVFNSGCANYEAIKQLAERGEIDQKYLDAVQLTKSEVDAMGIDRNTNIYPEKGFVYDGTASPGTPFDESAGHTHVWNKGKVEKEPGCETEGSKVVTCVVCGQTKTETIPAAGHKWGKTSYTWAKDNSTVKAVRTCEKDSTHTESETAEITAETIVEVGCERYGRIKYTAVFSNPAFASVSKTSDSMPLGHSWGKCEVISVPTAESEGERLYTCVRCGNTKTESIPKVIDDITPTLDVADKAPSDKSIPKVSVSKIKTTGSVSKGQLKITFPKSSAADNYLIQYRTAGTSEPVNCWTGGKGSYTIKGLKKNGLYQIRILGYARQEDWSWHCGTWSDVIYRYMKSMTLKKVVPGKRKLTVTWSKDTNSTGYHVLYSTKKSMAGAKTKKISGKAKTKCTISKLKKGRKYYVKVMPVKVRGSKTYTGILSGAKAAKVK